MEEFRLVVVWGEQLHPPPRFEFWVWEDCAVSSPSGRYIGDRTQCTRAPNSKSVGTVAPKSKIVAPKSKNVAPKLKKNILYRGI